MKRTKLFTAALFAAAWLAGGMAWAQSEPAQDSDGWYLLGTVDDVEWFGQQVMDGKHATIKGKLTANIDYEGVVNRHRPIGNYGQKFVGKFDGQGHRILNMVLNDPTLPKGNDDGTGFFGCVRVGGDGFIMGSDTEKETNDLVEIKNLIIDASCTITSSRANTAGLVGRISERTPNNTVLIENCINEATIVTTANAPAGIVGQINNAADGNVIIRNCVNKGTVTTSGLAAAGIISQVRDCAVKLNIESCMNLADVKSTGNKNCGGIHGANTSSKGIIKIINCGNTGNVTGTDESAALTGWIGSNSGNVITNCWNSGTVTGVKGTDNTYRGTVTATNIYDKNGGQGTLITNEMIASGELCYRLNGDQSDIAWTQTLDGTQNYPLPVADGDQVFAHGTLNCDGTFAPGTSYNNEGPDGVDQIPHKIDEKIGICTNCYAHYQEPEKAGDYYLLKNAGNVEWLSNAIANGGGAAFYAKLMNDIDFLKIENLHNPLGPSTGAKFKGVFDGQGYSIKNMIINRPTVEAQGFFGWLQGNDNTTIKNLIIDSSCSIIGANKCGGLAGASQNSSDWAVITIENVVNGADVTVSGQDAAGIVGGELDGKATYYIHNVVNTGTITSTHQAPFAGALFCYQERGAIENFLNLGKIVGHNGGNIGRFGGTWTNVVDLSETDNKTQSVREDLTPEDIVNGKLAYVMGFKQLIGTDEYPSPLNAEEVNYVGDAGYATMYDKANDWALNGDATAYIAAFDGKKYLQLTEVKDVPAGAAVILKGSYYNKLATTATSDVTANALLGTDADKKADGTMYVLAQPEGEEVGFYQATGTIAAGKAYYQSTSGVKAFYFGNGDATSIQTIENAQKTTEDAIYNIAGQRLNKVQKGINIINGKKVLY